MKTIVQTLSIFVFILACTVNAIAGGCMESRTSKASPIILAARATSVRVNIQDQVAETVTQQTFVNNGTSPITLRYGFPLPSRATVSSVRWRLHGEWFVASMKASDSVGQQGGTGAAMPSFPSDLGQSPFVMALRDTLAADSAIDIEITYGELLPLRSGTVQYGYPVATLSKSGVRSIETFAVHIVSDRGIDSVMVLGKPQQESSVLTDVGITSKMLSASFKLKNASVTMGLLSTKEPGEDGYALFLISPQSTVSREDILPKRFTFVIDHSGSMWGTKMQQVKDAVQWCLQRLNPDDVFNVLAFDDGVINAFQQHERATAATIKTATDWVGGIQSNGGTNIMLALGTALKAYTTSDYVNVIVFLTDGIATVDQEAIAQANTVGTRIFVLGVGADVATSVLQGIADRNRGAAEFVVDINETTAKITSLFERISVPLIKNPIVTCSPDVLHDVYPGVIQDLYAGDQLVLVSRYTTAGPVQLTVSGTDHSGPVSYAYNGVLTDAIGNTSFVGKMWAQGRIDMLVSLMKNEPSTTSRYTEWKKEVIALGMKYKIVTPFTTYYDNGQKDPGNTSTGGGSATDVTETPSSAADEMGLVCAPSVMLSTCTISFTNATANEERVVVEVYSMSGVLIATLLDELLSSGTHRVQWDGRGADGSQVSSAQYVVRVRIGDKSASSFLTVLR